MYFGAAVVAAPLPCFAWCCVVIRVKPGAGEGRGEGMPSPHASPHRTAAKMSTSQGRGKRPLEVDASSNPHNKKLCVGDYCLGVVDGGTTLVQLLVHSCRPARFVPGVTLRASSSSSKRLVADPLLISNLSASVDTLAPFSAIWMKASWSGCPSVLSAVMLGLAAFLFPAFLAPKERSAGRTPPAVARRGRRDAAPPAARRGPPPARAPPA